MPSLCLPQAISPQSWCFSSMSRQEGHRISDLTPRSHTLDRLALGLRAGGPLHRGHLELHLPWYWAYRGPCPGPPACSVRGRGSAPADACGASRLSHGRQGCMEEPGGLGFGAAAGLRGLCTGADSDTPGLESGCLGKRRKQSSRCAPSKPVTAESSVWTGGQGAHFSPGLRVSGSRGAGPRWEGTASCFPAPAGQPPPAPGFPGVETQHWAGHLSYLWTRHWASILDSFLWV